ncbi:unnamed protein product, partial [Ectocarpus sp. 12 AP-2014]
PPPWQGGHERERWSWECPERRRGGFTGRYSAVCSSQLLGCGSGSPHRCGAMALQRRPLDPLGSREGSGAGLASRFPSQAPTVVGAHDPHLLGKQDHRTRGASHRTILQEMGSSPRGAQAGGQPRAQHR